MAQARTKKELHPDGSKDVHQLKDAWRFADIRSVQRRCILPRITRYSGNHLAGAWKYLKNYLRAICSHQAYVGMEY